jgi:hypothetical protein
VVADLDHPIVPAACVHRWRIGAPHGESCLGTCTLCGTVRSFTNERRPFGQPSKNRRPAPSVPPVLLHNLAATARNAGLLGVAESGRRELLAE